MKKNIILSILFLSMVLNAVSVYGQDEWQICQKCYGTTRLMMTCGGCNGMGGISGPYGWFQCIVCNGTGVAIVPCPYCVNGKVRVSRPPAPPVQSEPEPTYRSEPEPVTPPAYTEPSTNTNTVSDRDSEEELVVYDGWRDREYGEPNIGMGIALLLLTVVVASLCIYFFVIRSKRINATKKFLLSIGILYLFWVGLVISDGVFRWMGSSRMGVESWDDVLNACLSPLIVTVILLCLYFFVIRPIARKIKRGTNQIKEKIQYIKIPEICPHCKNPNPDKKTECEWCGNKIC